MNTQLQELIKELTAEKEKAQAHADMNDEVRQLYMSSHFKGKAQAFSLCIEKLTKILNEGSVAAREDIHFRVDFKNGKIIRTRRD